MKRILFLSAVAISLAACNANQSGTGGNPAQDSVTPATEGKGYSNDAGSGGTKGGSSDPMNGGGPQTLNSPAGGGDSMAVAPNTDTAANKRTPAMQKAGGGKTQ